MQRTNFSQCFLFSMSCGRPRSGGGRGLTVTAPGRRGTWTQDP